MVEVSPASAGHRQRHRHRNARRRDGQCEAFAAGVRRVAKQYTILKCDRRHRRQSIGSGRSSTQFAVSGFKSSQSYDANKLLYLNLALRAVQRRPAAA